jgi:division protein CdvB (Snf7/Vps24/ESCRT-III family)
METNVLNSDFLKDWDGERKEPVFARVNGKLHHKAPMKEQLAATIYRLRVQENKLESAAMRMQQHDRDIFTKCVDSQMAHDTARAAMYANECAEVRKMAKVTLHCQLALEQVSLRLETVEEFGDMAKLMAPAAAVVHSIKNQISGLIPEVGFELSEIGEVLNNVVAEAGETVGNTYDMDASGAEAQKILTEANSIADQHIKNRFPELPVSGVPTAQRTGELSPSR